MKRFNIKIMVAAVLMMILAVFSWKNDAFAEGKRAFALSPMSQRVILTPGETYKGSLTVANPATATEDFNYLVTVAPFYPAKLNDGLDDYGTVTYTEKTNANMIVDWTKVDNPEGTLTPNEERAITFSIKVPDTAPAGGQYLALLVRENPKIKTEEDSMSVTEVMQMAHVIYADVAGETVKTGEILENNLPSFLMTNELKATARVKNTGNIHTDAEFILQVWPMFSDEEICTNEEDASMNLIVPDTERYHVETCKLPFVGVFRAKQTVRIFGEESVVEKTILVCPLWLLFIVVLAIVALVIWVVVRAKTRKKTSDN